MAYWDEDESYDPDESEYLSPFEEEMGRQWTEADQAQIDQGQNPPGVTQDAIDVYQSGGADYPGPDLQSPSGGGQTSQPTSVQGVPQDWLEDFLRRNPGDIGRAQSAYQSNNFSKTNIPGGTAAPFPAMRLPGFNFGGGGGDGFFSFLQSQMQDDRARRQSWEDQLRSTLMAIMQQNQGAGDVDTINQTPEARAFARVRQRQLQKFRAQQAERRARQGTGAVQGSGEIGGALQSDIVTGEQELGERLAAMESQMVARQLSERRNQLMQALSIGAGVLGADQQNELRRELAAIDAALRQQALSAQMNQFYDQLGYQVGLQEAMMNQGAFSPFF